MPDLETMPFDAMGNTESRKHKFRELKVYASTEWLADNKKKYRQVFDRYEVAYIYAELSLYNKLFDIEDWEVDIELRCYAVKKGKTEMCILPFKKTVSKFDNIVYIREGWGNRKEGTFWKKGTYYWEAYVDGERVGSKYFYIEEATAEDAPYLDIHSLKLYEGPYDDLPDYERRYFKAFSGEETRYIYAEIILKNLNENKIWQCEILTKFLNHARELKGQVVRMHRVEKKDEYIYLTAGWGSNTKGSWKSDLYSCDIVFMDRTIVSIPFEVGSTFEEGWLPVTPLIAPAETAEEQDPRTFEELLVDLENLVGLDPIKQKVKDHAKYLQFLQMRKEKGFQENEAINIHSVFTGNPGTGKTTVARMMGKLYQKMGLLTKGHVLEVDRVDLVGEYIGQTAPKVREIINKAQGGVLFIDEAYSLSRSADDTKDFGKEAIEILVKEMSAPNPNFAVVVAGYPKEMKVFVESNPGLKSRFKHFFDFPDYMPQELSEIMQYFCTAKSVALSPAAEKQMKEIITEAYRTRNKTFGNARFVADLVEQGKINMGLRVMAYDFPQELTNDEIAVIQIQDVEKIQLKVRKRLPNIQIDESLLRKSMSELNQLIGMGKVKEQIQEMVRLVRFYRETGKDVLGGFSLHTVFLGNPGTGKTTVARILTNIYKALGILERGQVVETDRQGLVAGYVGQTAIKTTERIEEALGGVLFIDEAYALASYGGAGRGDFGDEAIQTLLKRMEDQRGDFFVFVAGYTDLMEAFIKANPGLASRFDKTLRFDDYSPEELMQIAVQMFHTEGLQVAADAADYLHRYLVFLHDHRDKYFGNARTVRQVVLDIIKKQNLRLANVPSEERTPIAIQTVTVQDIGHLKMDKSEFVFNRKTIGFKV